MLEPRGITDEQTACSREDCGSDPAWIAAVFKQMGPSAEADLHKYTQMRARARTHTNGHVHTLSIIQEKVADRSGNALRGSS